MFDFQGVKITWLGHAAFRMRSGGKTFYFDPFLNGNPKCPEQERQPTAADAILVSHGHGDHVGDTVAIARETKCQVLAMVEVGMWLHSQGLPQEALTAMNKGGTVTLAGARVTMVHALHSSSAESAGLPVYLGEPAGYVVGFPEGLRLYFAGDTSIFGDMQLIGELYRPQVACLPIGDYYTMGPFQAAHACRLLGVKAVIPMHYGTFPALTGTPTELRKHLTGIDCEVVELQPGQTIG